MPIHFYNLLLRAFFAVPTSLGSTWLGLFFPLWGFLIAQVVILFSDGWGKMKTHWRQNVVRGFAVAGAAWASLFLWCVITTTYADHTGLAARVGTLRRTVDADAQHEQNTVAGVRQDLGTQLSTIQQSCAEMKGANGALTKQATDQQGTINNCQTEALKLLAPEPMKLSVFEWSDDITDGVFHKATYLVVTNKPITPVNMIVSCDVALKEGVGSILGSGFMSGGSEVQQQKNLNVNINSPSWPAQTPLRIDLQYTSSRKAKCSFFER
jgi:hypothetical protein